MRLPFFLRRLRRARRGSIYIELVGAMLLLSAIFIGSAVIGSKTIDMDRDTRAVRSALDLAYVLDDESGPPSQADIDAVGRQVISVMSVTNTEDFQIHMTVIEFDHRIPATVTRWNGAYGTDPSRSSRVSIGGGLVTVDGFDFSVEDDEALVIVEIYRSRRGLFPGPEATLYSNGVVVKFDPDQA